MSRYKTKAAQERQRGRVWAGHAVECDECGTLCESTGTVTTDHGTERVGICGPCQAAEAAREVKA